MVVLALETVTPRGSLAVWHDGICRASTGDVATPHAVRLPDAAIAALTACGVSLEGVDRLAIVSGPGSFTGVRIGMASAQGLALTRGWSVVPVPTLDAIAECWLSAHLGQAPRTVVACLDGLRGEIFTREFQFDGVALHAQGPPGVGTPSLLRWQSFGAGVSFVGNGAVRYAETWRSVSHDVADVTEPMAAGAARLAARGALPAVAPHALRPEYVRRPDVELARQKGRAGVR